MKWNLGYLLGAGEKTSLEEADGKVEEQITKNCNPSMQNHWRVSRQVVSDFLQPL